MVSNAAPQFFVLHDGLSPATGRAPQLTAGGGGVGGSYGETCNLRGSTATAADRNSVTIAGWTRCGGAAQRSSVAAAGMLRLRGRRRAPHRALPRLLTDRSRRVLLVYTLNSSVPGCQECSRADIGGHFDGPGQGRSRARQDAR